MLLVLLVFFPFKKMCICKIFHMQVTVSLFSEEGAQNKKREKKTFPKFGVKSKIRNLLP